MRSRPMPARARTALVTGAATTLYYATPDVVRSRTARGWLKAGLTAVTFAASVPDLRAMREAGRAPGPEGGAPWRVEPAAGSPGRRVAAVGVATILLACTAGVLVAVERSIFRRGQARAASGTRLAHTRTALLLGALAAGLTLAPVPPASGEDVPAWGREDVPA